MADKQLTMADLLAKQENKFIAINRGEEITGTVIEILPQEIILDLGAKAEGVMQKRDLSNDAFNNLKIGDKLTSFVLHPENESGQVALGVNRLTKKTHSTNTRLNKFESALKNNQVLTGKGIEVNKGGLIVEVNGIRGFLPSSQVSLSMASDLDQLIDKDLQVTVIEVDPSQNRLIFSQKMSVTDDIKTKLGKLKMGDTVEGKVAAVLAFGVFITLSDGVEGLVHISEISWDKVEDPALLFKVGDSVKARVTSVDETTGRANLSIKQLEADPFSDKVKDILPDDVIKGTVTKVSSMGVNVTLENGMEGLIPSSKLEESAEYKAGDSKNFLVDSIDTQKRRINLVPFLTSTKDLIYK